MQTHTCFSYTSTKPYTNTENMPCSVLVQEFILLWWPTKIRCLYVFHMDPCCTIMGSCIYHVCHLYVMLYISNCIFYNHIVLWKVQFKHMFYRLLPHHSCWGLWNAIQSILHSFLWGEVKHSTKSNHKEKMIRMAVINKSLFQWIYTISTLTHFRQHGKMLKIKQTWK
jgi:hypothetical protein